MCTCTSPAVPGTSSTCIGTTRSASASPAGCSAGAGSAGAGAASSRIVSRGGCRAATHATFAFFRLRNFCSTTVLTFGHFSAAAAAAAVSSSSSGSNKLSLPRARVPKAKLYRKRSSDLYSYSFYIDVILKPFPPSWIWQNLKSRELEGGALSGSGRHSRVANNMSLTVADAAPWDWRS